MTNQEFRSHLRIIYGNRGGWLREAAQHLDSTPAEVLGWLNDRPIPVYLVRSIWWVFSHLTPPKVNLLSAEDMQALREIYRDVG
jgi:hypothetical protein